MYPDDGRWSSALSYLECARCAERYDPDQPHNLCRCGSPLLARYDLDRVRTTVRPSDLGSRGTDLWRYRELPPVRDPGNVVTLGEGMTPIVPLPGYGRQVGVPGLLVKDEGLLPTGSFKARRAAVGVSRARELGVDKLTLPTNGNAGAAWATYAVRAGMNCLVVMPQDAPQVTRKECLAAAGAVRRLRADGWLDGDEEVLVLNTGSALKYPDTLPVADPPALERDAALPKEATAAPHRAAGRSATGTDGGRR